MVLALEIGGTNLLESLGHFGVLGHRTEKVARLLGLHIEAQIFARWRVRVAMRPRSGALRLDGVNEREGEQLALAGESDVAEFEAVFADFGVRVGGDEAALSDDVEFAGFRLHFAKRNARYDLLIEVVLPIRDVRLKLVEQGLFGAR